MPQSDKDCNIVPPEYEPFFSEYCDAYVHLCECSDQIVATEQLLRWETMGQFMQRRRPRRFKRTREVKQLFRRLTEQAFALKRAYWALFELCKRNDVPADTASRWYLIRCGPNAPGIRLYEKDGKWRGIAAWNVHGRSQTGYYEAKTQQDVEDWFFQVGASM